MIDSWSVQYFDSLPSTNTWLLDHVRDHPATTSGAVIVARAQTAGRGRQQRAWQAKPNHNLTFSFLWNAPVAPAHVPSMAQAIAVGLADFLSAIGLNATLKWPNDVQLGGKKIAGILCEAMPSPEGHLAIVAGVGLNVNMSPEDAATIDQPATSLAIETGRNWELDQVLPEVLGTIRVPLNNWATAGFKGIQEAYETCIPTIGKRVSVRDGDHHTHGTLLGFSDQGALKLRLETGATRVFYSGDLNPNQEDFPPIT